MDMRSTLGDTLRFFSKYPDEGQAVDPSGFRQFFTHRLELYKVAAVFFIAIGIGFLLSRTMMNENPEQLAVTDTVHVTQYDTLYLTMRDTIEVIREKTVDKNVSPPPVQIVQTASGENEPATMPDCSQEICPDDLASLSHLSRKNSISHDKELTMFTASLY